VSDILREIVEHKRVELAAAKAVRPESELKSRLADAPPPRDFAAALRDRLGLRVIAEVKRASPSAGLIRGDFDPVAIARRYTAAGAAAISVLTDEHYFQGRLEYLTQVRAAVPVPVLRKDFLIDRYQVLEARVAGADAILLIAECLNDCTMRDLYFHALELGMTSLIEIHDPENLDRVLKLDPDVVGVNNRDLRTLTVDLEHSIRLRPRVTGDAVFVSESGIHTPADVRRLTAAGVRAVLVGETLMKSPDPGEKLAELIAAGASENSTPTRLA
jgi:indole-3-glycerol phosphate synthase